MSIHLDEEAPPFDPESRRLCGDAACIGVIGTDGHCLECGRIGEGEEPHLHRVEADEVVATLSPEPTADHSAERAVDESEVSDEDFASRAGTDELDARRLCSDPGCIGVLDDEGRCSECGRTTNFV